jgi:hypothetical protein
MKRFFATVLSVLAVALAAGPAFPKTPSSVSLEPLTFRNVQSFFSDTLHIRPTEVQKRCVLLYEGEWKSTKEYNYCLIIVENSDEDLQVTFYLTDDAEMNWVNEFLDGPFFTKRETEGLFGLLHREHPTRDARVGRFRVDVSHFEPRHAEIIVFSFTPLQNLKR